MTTCSPVPVSSVYLLLSGPTGLVTGPAAQCPECQLLRERVCDSVITRLRISGTMAGLENQIRGLSLGPGPPVVTRYMTGLSPGPGLMAASRGHQPRTASSLGSVTQGPSPTILNSRAASRNDAR